MTPTELVALAKEIAQLEQRAADLREMLKLKLNHAGIAVNGSRTGFYLKTHPRPHKLSIDYPTEYTALQAWADGTIEWEK